MNDQPSAFDEVFGPNEDRPTHPDFTAIVDACLQLDSGVIEPGMDDGNETYNKAFALTGFKTDSATFMAVQRAYRALGITSARQLAATPGAAQSAIHLASAWLDGFAIGALAKEKLPPTQD